MQVLSSTLSEEEWLDKIYRKSGSKSSKNMARVSLKHFEVFIGKKYNNSTKEQIIEELRIKDDDSKYVLLNKFAEFLGSKNPGTIQHYVSYVRKYLRSQGIKTTIEEMKELVTIPTLVKDEQRKPLGLDTIKTLLDNCKERRRGLYLTLLSSGMRVGECLNLRVRDFDFTQDPVLVTIPGKFTKTKQARQTYISREAKEVLLRMVKSKSPDEPVFIKKISPHMVVTQEKLFSDLREKCGITERYPDTKRFVVNIHAFRSYFHTKASKVHGDQYANAIDGHQSYLGQYYRLTDEERAKMYKELEPNLLIYTVDIPKKQRDLESKLTSQQDKIQHLEELVEGLSKKMSFYRDRSFSQSIAGGDELNEKVEKYKSDLVDKFKKKRQDRNK